MAREQVPTYGERVLRARQLAQELFDRLDRGEDVDFEVLRGHPGVRLEAITWEELEQAVKEGTEESLGSMGRHPLGIKRYFDSRPAVNAKYASVPDYLMVTIFGVPSAPGQDGRLVAAVPSDFHDELRVQWVHNEFPYFYEEGIEHHNVWANQPLTTEQLEQCIAEHRVGYETLWYVQPPHLQSVPTIWHAHVMSRWAPSAKARASLASE